MTSKKVIQASGKSQLLSAADASRICRVSRRTTTNKAQRKVYPLCPVLSGLKEEIGQLLLDLQNPSLDESQRQELWGLVERELREYLAIKHPHR